MNIRIKNNHLRFRLSSDELKELSSGDLIKEDVFLPSEQKLSFEVSKGAATGIEFADSSICLGVSDADLQELSKEGVSADGLSYELPVRPDQLLKVNLEVDLRST